jgi:hypothetical protein
MRMINRLVPFKRQGSKVLPTYPPKDILEKPSFDSSVETLSLWDDSESSLSFSEQDLISSCEEIKCQDVVKTATLPAAKPRKSVAFSFVEVREYGLVLGDSPDIDNGFPLMLDWRYNKDTKILPVDEHQEQGEALNRSPIEELDPHQRRWRLRSMGFSEAELRLAERRRKILLSHEWAYGSNKQNPPPFIKPSFVDRYIK